MDKKCIVKLEHKGDFYKSKKIDISFDELFKLARESVEGVHDSLRFTSETGETLFFPKNILVNSVISITES